MNSTSLNVRVPPDILSALDSLIARQPEPKPSRPEAVRQILATALNLITQGSQGAK